MSRSGKKPKQKLKGHTKCGRKCLRNHDRSWPLMPDGLTPAAAQRWHDTRYGRRR